MTNSPIIIFDGNNIVFRVVTILDLTNDAGISVSVPFGVIRSIRSVMGTFKPKEVIVVWDGGRNPHRIRIHPEYKITKKRKRTKERLHIHDISGGIKITQELLGCLGVPQMEIENNEADDIIANLAIKLHMGDADRIIIVSTDKDFFQLIDRQISVYNPINATLICLDNFEKYSGGLTTPKLYLEFHILLGDESDNIPGITGIGKKTAKDLILQFGTIQNAVDSVASNLSKFNKRVLNILTDESKKQLTINRKLIDLRRFVERVSSFDNMKSMHVKLDGNVNSDYEKFRNMISSPELDFKSIIKDFNYWVMPFRKLVIRRRMQYVN